MEETGGPRCVAADLIPAYRNFLATEGGQFLTLIMFLGLFMFSGRVILPVADHLYGNLIRIMSI